MICSDMQTVSMALYTVAEILGGQGGALFEVGGGAVPPHFFEGLDNLTLQNKKRELQASNLLPL